MVQDVCADVVVDLVEDAVVTVQGGQAASQVAPLLHTRRKSVDRIQGRSYRSSNDRA